MYANIDQVPAGKHLFTVYVTGAPVGTDREELWPEEIDVVADRNANVEEILAAMSPNEREGYARCRVVGVIDQSDDYPMFDNPDSTTVVGTK